MSKTGAGLAAWAEKAIAGKNFVYWYGTYCNPCTKSRLDGKTRQYPTHYTDKRRPTYLRHIEQGKTCTDCVGLIKGYYWEKDGAIAYKRNGLPDKGATGMYNATKIKGSISHGLPEIPGLLLWTKGKGHVGVYVGNGYVVEARGFSEGVQRNKVKSRSFKFWGICPYIEYTADQISAAQAAMDSEKAQPDTSSTSDTPTIREGSTGDAVKKLQKLLIKKGYPLPKHGADGACGAETVEAIKAYQAANGLDADGICGPKTWASLQSDQATSKPDAPATPDKLPTIRRGSKGDAVKKLQKLLIEKGYTLPRYGVDGSCGTETVTAIKAYQAANSLDVDGICGAKTWASLQG